MNIMTVAASSSRVLAASAPTSGNGGTPPKKERRKASSDRRANPTTDRRQIPDRRATRVFFRGTNLQPTGEKVQACLIDSKQSILVDLLSRPEGATMEELIQSLSGGRRPWTEATVRSGFGWDLKRKGYGVRSEFDPTGEERFHLIVPKGQKVPKHLTREQARAAKAKATRH